ncbi:RICIN domain-containing protein [Streptomyces tubercidicus]|uniref:RICIN domain-containing protein n=1 Tax=Streptomyces tubercidicus TaxID=47759 RepID=UPI0034652E53
MIIELKRRGPGLRGIAAMLATTLAGLGIVMFPLTETAAHADTGSSGDISAVITARDQNNGSLNLARNVPQQCNTLNIATDPYDPVGTPAGPQTCTPGSPEYDFTNITDSSPKPVGSWSWNQQFKILPNADGTFRLKSNDGPCINADASGNLTDSSSDCSNADKWNLQPPSDATSGYSLIRHVGDNKCLAPKEGAVSQNSNPGVVDCDGTKTAQQWSIATPNNETLPTLSNGAAIDLGASTINVCNKGGYAARAEINYKVRQDPASDTDTAGNQYIESFPAGQCRSVTLPAGKVSATVELRRYTGWYMGDYAFAHGAAGQFVGAGKNDVITGVWTLAGVHANATYTMHGASCDSSSSFDQTSDSQAASTKAKDQDGCTGPSTADAVKTAVETGFGILMQIFSFALNPN